MKMKNSKKNKQSQTSVSDCLHFMDRLHLVSLEIDRKHGLPVEGQIQAVKKRIIDNLKSV